MRFLIVWLSSLLIAWASPVEVARQFWQALQTHQISLAQSLTVRGSVVSDLPFDVQISNVKTKPAVQKGAVAKIPTFLHFRILKKGLQTPECNTTIETELLRIDGRWRVDGIVTMKNFGDGILDGMDMCAIQIIHDSLNRGKTALDMVLEELLKTEEKLLKKLEKKIQKYHEEIQKPSLPPSESGERI